MTSHELARRLLDLPDLPVATHANNETYASQDDHGPCGALKIGLLTHYAGDHIVVGSISKMNLNAPNWFVSKMLHGEAPWEWWCPGQPLRETPEAKAKAAVIIAGFVERMRVHRERMAAAGGKWTLG